MWEPHILGGVTSHSNLTRQLRDSIKGIKWRWSRKPTPITRRLRYQEFHISVNGTWRYTNAAHQSNRNGTSNERNRTINLHISSVCVIQEVGNVPLRWLTQWSKSTIFFDMVTGSTSQKKKITAIYGIQRFNVVFSRASQLAVSWASYIQSTPSHPTSWYPPKQSPILRFSD